MPFKSTAPIATVPFERTAPIATVPCGSLPSKASPLGTCDGFAPQRSAESSTGFIPPPSTINPQPSTLILI
ncbi:MAG: hypothetical protein IJ914_08445 [Prevotella sp.]|nr:hypothetical protein [Prevotella sp.]